MFRVLLFFFFFPLSCFLLSSLPQYKVTFFFKVFFWLHWTLVAARTFSSCGEQGPLLTVVLGLLLGGFSGCGARALGSGLSVAAAHGLWSAGSVLVTHGLSSSAECGIFQDQGSNSCHLDWQVDSYPLHH